MITRLFLILSLISGWIATDACTAVIISGKATPDGRPVLWKNRDTDQIQNAIKYFDDGKYSYIGLINSNDPEGKSVWAGYNSAGFAIINTVSYNLISKDTVKLRDQEGIIMREALKVCATVGEFAVFLQNRPKPLGVSTNFGVIDAAGGAAWFETDNFSFRLLDVNDPAQAPAGYIIHTNFSFTGDPKQGSGHIRFKTAEDLFFQASQQNNLTVRFILQDVSRSLWHSLTATDLRALSVNAVGQKFVNFTDFIPRYSTTASVAIQGVLTGENPDYMTMWTILGFPLTSVVFPLWLCNGVNQPELVCLNGDGVAPLCDKALTLKKKSFPVIQNYGGNYIDLATLYNTAGTGYLQKLQAVDDTVFDRSLRILESWRGKKDFHRKIPEFYRETGEWIRDKYHELFGI